MWVRSTAFAMAVPVLTAGCLGNTDVAEGASSVGSAAASFAAFTAAGSQSMAWPALIEGDTVRVTYPGGVVMYHADGRKIFTSTDGKVTTRSWTRSPGGIYCETQVRSGVEVCSDLARWRLQKLDDVMIQFDDDGNAVFKMVRTGRGQYLAQPI